MHIRVSFQIAALLVILWPLDVPAQPVLFEELENHKIDAYFVYTRTVRRIEENRIAKNESHNNLELRILPGNRIEQTYTAKTVTLTGREVRHFTSSRSLELNKPTHSRSGEMIFLFDQSTLIRLQTFNSGGRKIAIAFTRRGSGFACSVDAPFSREEGTEGATDTTSFDGQRIQIVSAMVKKSSCSVSKL